MKKQFFTLTAFVLTTSMVLFSGCSQDDTTPPVITLGGSNPMTLALNSNYVDPSGTTAEDDEDGDVTSAIVVDASDVNKDVAGTYSVEYSVSDAAGNVGYATRTVNVANQLTSSAWVGNYSCLIVTPGQSNYTYNDGNVISTTLNNALAWNKFGDYSNATAKLNMIISGSGSVSIPSQTFTCGTPAVSRTFSGSGNVTGTGTSGSTIVLTVAETTNGATINSTYTFTKQ